MPEIPYTVEAVLKVDSDWASVLVIADVATIEKAPGFVYPADVRFSETQILFKNIGQPEKKDFPFLIVGSTQPADFITAHGNIGTGLGLGNVTVEIFTSEPSILVNTEITGDEVNAKVFPKVPLYSK